MRWTIFAHRPHPGAASGTEELSRWEIEGDDEGCVADEACDELGLQGYSVIDVRPAEPEREKRRSRRR